MCESLNPWPWRVLSAGDFRLPSLEPRERKAAPPEPVESLYDVWLASRGGDDARLMAGAQRPINFANAQLAHSILRRCGGEFFKHIWSCHPIRFTLLMALNIVRSLFPAFRGYSQALIIDEIQILFASGVFTWPRLLRLISTEIVRRILEGLLDSLAVSNENSVLGSTRFFVEQNQLELRVRLDAPALADPLVRDLLQESDLFTRSFIGGGFGLMSPLDFLHIFAILAEIISHLVLIFSLTSNATHFGILILSVFSVAFPLIVPWFGFTPDHSDTLYTPREAQASSQQEKMRNFAYNDAYRSEMTLFGLGDWVVNSWASAWKVLYDAEQTQQTGPSLLSEMRFSDLLFSLQNIPFILLLQASSASLGSLTLYRNSVQAVVLCCRSLSATTRMAFQAIFMMLAFCASMELKPMLQPKDDEVVAYRSIPGGVSMHVRGLSYTYPGSTEPALRNVDFSLNAGESLAIVGYNGSGKSTLARILLRLVDFDSGDLFLNGVPIRRYDPAEYHKHLAAVFQDFSKYNLSLQENVGLGYVDKMASCAAIQRAVHLAEADNIVRSLPDGMRTTLESPGFEAISHFSEGLQSTHHPHGLSGGEWQRVAVARAFMRANEPEVDLLVFDEPTSSLDAHAQNQIFDQIHRISRDSTGRRTKTVIFITHRLSTARRADKVAMMENGTISEFGTHEELLRKGGSYAALYYQSV